MIQKSKGVNRLEYKERLIECKLLPLTYRREIYDLVLFIKSLRKLIPYNILHYVTIQTVQTGRLTRNRVLGHTLTYTNLKLESSAHFYPIRLARQWNKLPTDLRTKLLSPAPLASLKSMLNGYYLKLPVERFESDNVCTSCRCTKCHP